MPREIKTQVDIHASAQRVWQILTDFPGYAAWNPFITRLAGQPQQDTQVRFWFTLPFGGSVPARATVLKAEPGVELRWAGALPIPGLLRAEHYHVIESLGPNQVRFHQGEIFTGVLVAPFWPLFATRAVQLYEQSSLALKQRAEAGRA
jgi:hypothetical protein